MWEKITGTDYKYRAVDAESDRDNCSSPGALPARTSDGRSSVTRYAGVVLLLVTTNLLTFLGSNGLKRTTSCPPDTIEEHLST